MDNEAQQPETMAQRIQAVTALVEGQGDDVIPQEASSDALREETPEPVVRSDDSGSGAVDSAEPDAPESVEDDTQDESQAADSGLSDSVSLNDLAKHLELEDADLYDIEVPIGDGVTATISQLKDEFKQYGTVKDARQQIDDDRADYERTLLATRAELNAMLGVIPPEMRDQALNQARLHQASWEKEQEQTVLEAIPEWADADQRAKDRELLIADGAEYGFSEPEITHTQDARTLRMLRDFSKMKRELSEMRTAAKAQPGIASAPGKGAKNTNSRRLRQLIGKGKQDPTMQGKASVVSQLIRNQ